MPNRRRDERIKMGAGAVLSLNEAAQLLPLHNADAREWLADRGLVRSLQGRPVVVWADVLSALGDDQGDPTGPGIPFSKRVPL